MAARLDLLPGETTSIMATTRSPLTCRTVTVERFRCEKERSLSAASRTLGAATAAPAGVAGGRPVAP